MTPKQIKKLTVLLRPFMRKEQDREGHLYAAFGDSPVFNQIDCTGKVDIFTSNLIRSLADFGAVGLEDSESKLAIVLLLEYVREKSGVDIKKKIDQFIKEISSPPQPENGSKLLDLYSFSVQILSLIEDADDITVGTGIIVKGKIVTTAQVILSAGIDPRKAKDAEIGVRLPRTSPGIERTRRARVAVYLEEYDDDIVVLELTSNLPSLNPFPIGDAGKSIFSAKESCGNPFRSYVFTGNKDRPDDYIDGEIVGQIEASNTENLCGNLLRLKPKEMQLSPHLAMRGAGVLDKERNLIVGLISTIEKINNNSSLATAVDIYLLYYQPIDNVLKMNNGVES